jgi:hypothetical protein
MSSTKSVPSFRPKYKIREKYITLSRYEQQKLRAKLIINGIPLSTFHTYAGISRISETDIPYGKLEIIAGLLGTTPDELKNYTTEIK